KFFLFAKDFRKPRWPASGHRHPGRDDRCHAVRRCSWRRPGNSTRGRVARFCGARPRKKGSRLNQRSGTLVCGTISTDGEGVCIGIIGSVSLFVPVELFSIELVAADNAAFVAGNDSFSLDMSNVAGLMFSVEVCAAKLFVLPSPFSLAPGISPFFNFFVTSA